MLFITVPAVPNWAWRQSASVHTLGETTEPEMWFMYLCSACCSSMKTAGWAERSCEGLSQGWGDEGLGKGAGGRGWYQGGWVLHASVCYLRSYRWFLFSCGFEKTPAYSAGGPFLPKPNLELPDIGGDLKGLWKQRVHYAGELGTGTLYR